MNTKKYFLNIARIAIGLLILLQSNGKALAFKTDGPDIHAEITSEALPFIRPDIMDDITDEADLEDIGNANDPDHHFDDCHFVGSTFKINDNLENARNDANPAAFDSGDLADKWGQLIHTSEDFYSHSNWVDSGQTTLIDAGVSFWATLTPYSIHDGVMIVEGEDEHPLGPNSSLSLDAANKTVNVFTGSNPPGAVPANTNFPGIISGYWPSNSSDDCPDNVKLSHGDLNKDTPEASLFLFQPAYDLATQQTRQEWCRLLHVSRDEYGMAGPATILGLWVKPNGNPHPQDTQCAPVDPGPTEVVASISNIQIIEDEDDGAGQLNFVFLLINQNLEQSVRNEVANSLSIDEPAPVPADQIPDTLRMCVKTTDTVAVSLQGWDDDEGPDGEFNNSSSGALNADDALEGVTLTLGPGFAAGPHKVSSKNLEVTFTVASNTSDSDNDGLGDCAEKALGTLPNNPDSDNDGLKDGIEVKGSNPTNPLIADSDNDALLDGIEDANHNGTWDSGETNPNNPDTDQDILQDGCEVLGSNPTKPLDWDSDDDSLPDGVEDANHNCALDPNETNPNDADSDDDGLNDGFEVTNGTNPLDADSDDDGIPDGEDVEWIQGSVNALPDSAFKGIGNRNAIRDELDTIEAMRAKGKLSQALNELKTLRSRVDGCGTSADGNDWIVDCASQIKIRGYIDLLIKNLTN